MGVHGEEERNEQVVSIPKGLERLLPDLVVGGGVHEQHAKKHHMASDASRLCIMDLDRRHRSNLSFLNVEKVDIVSEDVDTREDQHGVGALSVEPNGLIQGEELELWSDEAHQIPAHGKQNEHDVH